MIEINVNTSLTKITMQWMQIQLQWIVILIVIWFDDIYIKIFKYLLLHFVLYIPTLLFAAATLEISPFWVK